MAAIAGWLLAGVRDGSLVPAAAILAFAAAVAVAVVGVRRRTLASPLVVLGVPLLLSLAGAMQPVTQIFSDWSLSTLTDAVLIVAAPLAGIAVAIASSGRTPPLQRGTDAAPRASLLIATCAAMLLVGSAVYAHEWSGIGGPPLLSGNIDEARFSLNVGLIHVLTEGIPLTLLIATWARVGQARHFSAPQLRVLEAIMGLGFVVLALGGGRSFVLVPLIMVLVVAARYVSPHVARRMAIVIPIAILAFSTAIFITRIGQNAPTGAVGSVLYNDTGKKTAPWESAYRTVSINLGEQLRVVAELREAHIRTPPFTSSIWFAHNFFPRAIDPQAIAGPNAGGWLTATYAGGLLLDFGLLGALAFGVLLGIVAHALYRRFARGETVLSIWIYAYLASSFALAFYINMFLYFIFPILDLIGLFILRRLLVEPEPATAAQPAAGARLRPTSAVSGRSMSS